MNKRLTTLALGALASALLLGACGDDKKSSTTVAGGGGNGTDAYCARIEEYKNASNALDASMEDPTAESMKTAFETMGGMLHDLENGAPEAISADLATMNDSVDRMIAIFEQYDWDLAALAMAPEFEELNTVMESDEMTAVQDRLDSWSLDTCGIEMDGE